MKKKKKRNCKNKIKIFQKYFKKQIHIDAYTFFLIVNINILFDNK